MTSWELYPIHISAQNKSLLIKLVSDDHIRSPYVLRKVESARPLDEKMIRGPAAATQTWWYNVRSSKRPAALFFPIELQSLNINTVNIPLMWPSVEMSDCCNDQHFNEWRNIILGPECLWNSHHFYASDYWYFFFFTVGGFYWFTSSRDCESHACVTTAYVESRGPICCFKIHLNLANPSAVHETDHEHAGRPLTAKNIWRRPRRPCQKAMVFVHQRWQV